MNDRQLDHLLKEHFEGENKQEASRELVYKARQKAYDKQESRSRLEWVRPMIYMVLLHLLWSVCLIGVVFVVKGSGMVLQVIVANMMTSCMVVVAGCIVIPKIKERKEAERLW